MKGFCERKFGSMFISGTFTKAVMYIMLLCDSIIAGYFIGETGVAAINAITPVTGIVTFFSIGGIKGEMLEQALRYYRLAPINAFFTIVIFYLEQMNVIVVGHNAIYCECAVNSAKRIEVREINSEQADVDEDGMITRADAELIRSYYRQNQSATTTTSEEENIIGDANGDSNSLDHTQQPSYVSVKISPRMI